MEDNYLNTIMAKYDNLCHLELQRFKSCTSYQKNNYNSDSLCVLYESLYFNCQNFKKNKKEEFRHRRERDAMKK